MGFLKISESLSKDYIWIHWSKMSPVEITMFKICSCIRTMIKMFNLKTSLILIPSDNIILFQSTIQKLITYLFTTVKNRVFILLKLKINLKIFKKLYQRLALYCRQTRFARSSNLNMHKESSTLLSRNICTFHWKEIFVKSISLMDKERFITLIKC
jgi:hypothetical protein